MDSLVLWKIQSGHDSVYTVTDGQTDRRARWNQYTPHPTPPLILSITTALQSTIQPCAHFKGNSIFCIFQILMVGAPRVGKTCLRYRFCRNHYTQEYSPTAGFDYSTRTLLIDGEKVKVQVRGKFNPFTLDGRSTRFENFHTFGRLLNLSFDNFLCTSWRKIADTIHDGPYLVSALKHSL